MRNLKRLFVFVLTLAIFLGLAACSITFPKPKEGIWYCEELMIEIDFSYKNTFHSPHCGKKYNLDGTYENVLVYFDYGRLVVIQSEDHSKHYLIAKYLYRKDCFYVTTNEEKITYVFKQVDKPFKYSLRVEDVVSVQIVRMGDYDREKVAYEYTVLYEVTNVMQFVERLNNLEHYYSRGEPIPFIAQDVAIRIDMTYKRHHFVKWDTQQFYWAGDFTQGYFVFDEDQFKALIADYMPNRPTISG